MARFQHVYVLNVMSDDHPGIVAAGNCDQYDCASGRALALSSLGVSLILSAISASSAGHMAEDYNQRHRLGDLERRLRPTFAVGSGRIMLGLKAR